MALRDVVTLEEPFRLVHRRADAAEPGAVGGLLDVGVSRSSTPAPSPLDHDGERLSPAVRVRCAPSPAVRDRRAGRLDHPISGAKTVALRRRPGSTRPITAGTAGRGRLETDPLEESAAGQVVDDARPEIDDTFAPPAGCFDDPDLDPPFVEGGGDERLHRRLPRLDLHPPHRLDLVAGMEPGPLRDGARRHLGTIGRRPSTPIMYMHQYATIAKRKLNAGPATTTATRFGRDWRLNARWRRAPRPRLPIRRASSRSRRAGSPRGRTRFRPRRAGVTTRPGRSRSKT